MIPKIDIKKLKIKSISKKRAQKRCEWALIKWNPVVFVVNIIIELK